LTSLPPSTQSSPASEQKGCRISGRAPSWRLTGGGLRDEPSAAILYDQTVNSDGHGGDVGYDAGKQSRAASGTYWSARWGRCWNTGGASADWVKEDLPKIELEVIKRSDQFQGFAVLPRRWVLERTSGWLMRQRRWVRELRAYQIER